MCYTEYLGLSSTAGQLYQWRLNSLFDPNYTGTGNQPAFFDNLKAIYTTYCVTKAAITIEAINLSTSGARLALVPVEDPSVSLSTIAASQLPFASFANIGSTLSGNPQAFLGFDISIGQFLNVRDPQNDDALRSAINASPTLLAYADLSATSLDGTTLNLGFTARIIFDVVFSSLYPVYDT